ncbi:dynamin family protein [Ruegeria arenilitoris]|uniref:dynamin family protein n=1 Tax=Ruegeria arenilitoris TaxID=1173585 RepID=UPI0014818C2A|nr:dynamin family protein [Ruegeria arenilitoris]
MIEFPGTEQVVKKLESFLTATENTPSSIELDELRERAIMHAQRLSNTVAIGFAGEFGAGKSSLANMLAGADILPTGPQQQKLPLVIVAFAEEPETSVGWWGKEPKVYSGVTLEKAAADNPDFISVGLNTPALRDISLFDLPGSDALDESYKQTLALLDYVDCAIWCTNGTSAWRETERHLWRQVPKKLRESSLLAVTHADLLPDDEARDRVLRRLEKENSDMFQTVVPIGTPLAVKAMSQEPEPDFRLWESCGGSKLAEVILRVASEYRQSDLLSARNDLKDHFDPFLANIEAPVTVEHDTSGADGQDVHTSLSVSLPPLNNPILEDWLVAIAGICNELRENADIEPSSFLQSCQEIVEDFADRLDSGTEIDASADWVPGEFEKATDLLMLLQFESGDAPLRDAVGILAQLSDNLAWAGSTVASAPTKTGT